MTETKLIDSLAGLLPQEICERFEINPLFRGRQIFKWPDWVKEKISRSNKGKYVSPETKEKLKATIKKKGLNKGEKNPMYGKHHSEETLAKIRSNPNISHKKEKHPM